MPVPANMSKEQFLSEFEAGTPVNEIRAKFNTSHRLIARFTKELGLKRRKMPPRTTPDAALVGQRYGVLTIKEFQHDPNTNLWWAIIVCDCGNVGRETLRKLKNGMRKTCGKRGCPHFHEVRQHHGKQAGFSGHAEIFGSRWSGWRLGAEARGLAFDVSIEYAWSVFLAQERRCALSGVPLEFGNAYNKAITASLDRIDSTRGYCEGNIQWVHKRLNVMKGSLSDAEFVEWCHLVAQHAARR